jgi:hypothetical protein
MDEGMTLSILHFQQLVNMHFVAHQDWQDRQDKKTNDKDKQFFFYCHPAYPAHPVFLYSILKKLI